MPDNSEAIDHNTRWKLEHPHLSANSCDKNGVHQECPVHLWFELSYAQYLTIPRSILQAMPYEWREKFAALLNELDETIDWRPKEGCYYVTLNEEVESLRGDRVKKGKKLIDPLEAYRHPNQDYIESLFIPQSQPKGE